MITGLRLSVYGSESKAVHAIGGESTDSDRDGCETSPSENATGVSITFLVDAPIEQIRSRFISSPPKTPEAGARLFF